MVEQAFHPLRAMREHGKYSSRGAVQCQFFWHYTVIGFDGLPQSFPVSPTDWFNPKGVAETTSSLSPSVSDVPPPLAPVPSLSGRGPSFSGSSAESASDGTLDAPCFSRWRKPTPSPVASIALASCTLSCFGGPVGGACRMPARFRRGRKLAVAGRVRAVPLASASRKLGLAGRGSGFRSFSTLPKTRCLGLGAAWRSILSQRVRRSFRKGLA